MRSPINTQNNSSINVLSTLYWSCQGCLANKSRMAFLRAVILPISSLFGGNSLFSSIGLVLYAPFVPRVGTFCPPSFGRGVILSPLPTSFSWYRLDFCLSSFQRFVFSIQPSVSRCFMCLSTVLGVPPISLAKRILLGQHCPYPSAYEQSHTQSSCVDLGSPRIASLLGTRMYSPLMYFIADTTNAKRSSAWRLLLPATTSNNLQYSIV